MTDQAPPPKLEIRIIPVTPLQQNTSMIWSTDTMEGVFIDPGGEARNNRYQERGARDPNTDPKRIEPRHPQLEEEEREGRDEDGHGAESDHSLERTLKLQAPPHTAYTALDTGDWVQGHPGARSR